MAGYTDYLNLYFKNPSTDGADTFNIQTMMNDNWDKIDEFASMVGLPPAGNGFAFIRCKDEAGDPVAGCVVQINDLVSVSSAAGLAKFQIAAGTYSALVRAPIDYGLGEQTVSITVYNGKASEVDATISNTISNDTRLSVITSCLCAFSSRVSKADAFAIGAGASGGAAAAGRYNTQIYQFAQATGGGSGKTKTVNNIDIKSILSVTIGSGGVPVTAEITKMGSKSVYLTGNNGGTTIVKAGNNIIISADGGEGGNASASHDNSMKSINGASGGSGSGSVVFTSSSYVIPTIGESGVDGNDGGTVNASYPGGSGQGFTTNSFGESNAAENYSQAGESIAAGFSGITVGSCGPGAGVGSAAKNTGTSLHASASKGISYGSGGGAAAGVVQFSSSSGKADVNVTSGAGADGLVIFRWEVAS